MNPLLIRGIRGLARRIVQQRNMLWVCRLPCVLLISVGVGVALGQVIAAIPKEPGPKSPQFAAEPRRKLAIDPDTLLPRLLSPEARERADAFTRAGLEIMGDQEPQEVRLLALNIDSDPDLERVLIVKGLGGMISMGAAVYKKENGVWWQLGGFFCCGPGSQPNDPFIEMRQIVRYGTNDIVIHAGGSQGTSAGAWQLMVFRVWKGSLYKVLDIVESAYNFAGPEQTRVSYPNTEHSSAPPVISVHRTKEVRNRRSSTCTQYRWDADRFAFVVLASSRGSCNTP